MTLLVTTSATEPLVPFAILLVVIFAIPPLFERLRLPGLVGLLAAGVILGSNGFQVLSKDSETMKLLSGIGLVYLMFVAGLEVDLEQFRKTRNRSLTFGWFTFIVPMIFGTIVGRLFNFDWNASILIGSLFASHTLLAYPIVSRLGVVSNEAVTITIGATIFTDIGSLLVLAVCVGIHQGDFSVWKLGTLLLSLTIYSAAVLFGFDYAGKEYFRRSPENEGNQFLFVLLAVFLSALGAQLIGVEKIVGAFLAGLAVNDVVGDGPVKEKVVFVGSVLFIPIFFVDMGLIVDVKGFIASLSSIWLTLAIVLGLISSKFIAAWITKTIFRYTPLEGLAMWSLSLPQVAATLAATLVGYREGLLTEGVLNSVIVLMIVTSTLGPLITSRVAARLKVPQVELEAEESETLGEISPSDSASADLSVRFTVVVPVANPQTENYLVQMAALIARHENGRIVPISIAKAHAHMDAPELGKALQRSEKCLETAEQIAQSMEITAESLLRIDDNFAHGISRASREENANLIVLGWSPGGIKARLFGSVISNVLSSAHCPVAVTRLLISATEIKHILVPLYNLSNESLPILRLAKILAEVNQAQVQILLVCDRSTSVAQISSYRSQLELLTQKWRNEVQVETQLVVDSDPVKSILKAAQNTELAILRSPRQRSAAGLVISDVTTQILQRITCSVIMLGEPQ
ncbi:cation:proton antiporter domain-containing protein [Merismopedia glauca]|uniref:Sodium:proton antiporter n=1 Tax=Merismopedia glauca CCAP 1448/3 TaxID=1296344 RepID=A0A2T1C277_9CYAN|nr:cation:proton antiporter [Merismopedia glauca]PSB02257.1 sodium:proton antiporter [Merismopedia glauca CCAP 1448/3]